MFEAIGLIAGLATQIMKFVNDQNLTKHSDRMTAIQKDLLEEKARGQLSDDGKIEALEAEFHIEAAAFLQQLALLGTSK